MTDHSPALRAALDQLAAAMEALGPFERLPLAQLTLREVMREDGQPQAKPIWRAVHVLTQGATEERLDELTSALEVVGPQVRWAVATTAERAVTGDQPRTQVWAALRDVARAVEG